MERKTLIFLLVAFIAILSILFVYFFLRERLKDDEQSKYENIISTCMQDKGDIDIIKDDISCTAFMEDLTYEGDSVCFDFLVLNPSYEAENYSFCEQREKINWDEEFFNSLERTYPVDLKFVFEKDFFSNDRLQQIRIALIEGNAMDELMRIIYDNSIQIPHLYVKEMEVATYNGYNHTSDIEIFNGINPEGIVLDSVEILQVSYENEEFIIDAEVYLLGRTYKTQFNMKSINFYSENPEESFFIRNTQDLERYKENILQSLNGFFIYLDQNISNEKLSDYCAKVEDPWQVEALFCNNFKEFPIKEDGVTNVDEYIKLQTEQASGDVIELSQLLLMSFTKDVD
jgi:hypothetical protein